MDDRPDDALRGIAWRLVRLIALVVGGALLLGGLGMPGSLPLDALYAVLTGLAFIVSALLSGLVGPRLPSPKAVLGGIGVALGLVALLALGAALVINPATRVDRPAGPSTEQPVVQVTAMTPPADQPTAMPTVAPPMRPRAVASTTVRPTAAPPTEATVPSTVVVAVVPTMRPTPPPTAVPTEDVAPTPESSTAAAPAETAVPTTPIAAVVPARPLKPDPTPVPTTSAEGPSEDSITPSTADAPAEAVPAAPPTPVEKPALPTPTTVVAERVPEHAPMAPDPPFSHRIDSANGTDGAWPQPSLVKQAERVSRLDVYANDPTGGVIPTRLGSRHALLTERARLRAAGDAGGVARLNAVLSAEAFDRAARVTTRWLDRRDRPSGLFPHTLLRRQDRYFSYGDVGADLYPFLAIASRYLVPSRYPEILGTLAAERRLSPGFPRDRMLDTLKLREREPEDQMLANVEYAKDGLLPLVELLGPDPWLGRTREVVGAVLAASRVPTPRGPIPSEAAEVNGSLLQVLARLSWRGEDPRAIEMGRRIAAAYLDDMLPRTGDIPTDRWDFRRRAPIGAAELRLGDHGDEIVSGLIEWHRVETRLGLPEQAAHRSAINRMLDRLLAVGRAPNGLWYDGVKVPSGKIDDHALNDNWGYLGLAYLDQAMLLRASVRGDHRAASYEQAVRGMLQGATGVDFYKWERGEMDGYADTLESALYLFRYLDHPGAAGWVDEQMAVLYGFQHATGAVTDENIDGNFIRTVLQYGRWLTRGARLEPWEPTVAVGSAPDGACLSVHLHAARAWTGRLLFDTPRHRQHLGLHVDYPRLNQWQEWWVADPDQVYRLTLPDGSEVDLDGQQLAEGLELAVDPGHDYQIRVCQI